jgi:hypothetical protein
MFLKIINDKNIINAYIILFKYNLEILYIFLIYKSINIFNVKNLF